METLIALLITIPCYSVLRFVSWWRAMVDFLFDKHSEPLVNEDLSRVGGKTASFILEFIRLLKSRNKTEFPSHDPVTNSDSDS